MSRNKNNLNTFNDFVKKLYVTGNVEKLSCKLDPFYPITYWGGEEYVPKNEVKSVYWTYPEDPNVPKPWIWPDQNKNKDYNYQKMLDELKETIEDVTKSLSKRNAIPLSGTNKMPYYNIGSEYDGKFKIQVSLAGFDKEEISVSQEPYNDDRIMAKVIKIEARKDTGESWEYKGISDSDLCRSFVIRSTDEIIDCSYKNGILELTVEQDLNKLKKKEIKIK